MARKPGPKVDTTEPLERVTLTLDALTRRRLRVLGDGNESAGARVAARVAYDRYQRSDTAVRRGDANAALALVLDEGRNVLEAKNG